MRKILFIGLCYPLILFAQNNEKINLSTANCPCSVVNQTPANVQSITTDDDAGMPVAVIEFDNGHQLRVIALKKPITMMLIKKQMNQVLQTKNKQVVLKAIIKTGNELLLERKYIADGRIIYKSMYLFAAKGKEYMIESDELTSLDEAKLLLQTAKTVACP